MFGRNPVTIDTDHGFLVRTRDEYVCELGTTYDPSEIIIYKNLRMNSSRITNLPEPTLPHEVANKVYVDSNQRKILQGYVPNLRQRGGSNDKFGFNVTASSCRSNYFLPIHAFNGLYSEGEGVHGEWVTSETSNFWLQIKCPDLVRLWRIALRGRNSSTERIYRWQLEGSTDGHNFTTIFDPPNPTYIFMYLGAPLLGM